MTTVANLPSPWTLLEAALRARRSVEVSYHGRKRVISPHALGWSRGRPMVLGYQSGGQTSTGALPVDVRKRWRCMYVDDIDGIVAADPPGLWVTADNYNPSSPFHAFDRLAIVVTEDGSATGT